MGWGDRSRSPKKDWISRKLVQIGRYQDKRPHGLNVDASGTFALDNLMTVWGHSQGLSKEDVLGAVRENMINERTGRARYSLSGNDRTGSYFIQVHQSGGERGGGGGGGAVKQEDSWYEDKSNYNSYNESYHDWKDSNSNNGTAYSDGWKKPAQSDNWKSSSSPGWRYQHKPETTSTHQETNEEWKTAPTQNSSWNKAKGWRLQPWRGQGENITRYLGWKLKNSWGDDGIEVDVAGWAPLEQVVAHLRDQKKEFGINTVDDLKQTLQACDKEGRFAVDAHDRVRKVDRMQRQQPSEPTVPPTTRPSAATWSAAPRTKRGSAPFNAFTPFPKEEPQEAPHLMKQEPDEKQVDWGGDDDEEDKKMPKRPPGKHWEMFDDGGVTWWYYEGPKGKWWMQDGEEKPQPWVDAEDE
mmetsp:Transcript_52291/g.122123  ORF Transcript_52291/g.122123 Transcript_52291/m.122123 type:complete len:410 (-) Transcript_52291:146-1375(-)